MKQQTLQMLQSVTSQLTELAGMVRKDGDDVKTSGDHIEIIRHYNHLRIAMESIKESREALQSMADILSKDTVPESLRAQKIKTITIEGVGRVTVSHRFSCTMLDKDGGLTYLREIEQGGIIQETVNSSTLSAFAKSWIEDEGKELPEDKFKTHINPYTSITKVK